MFSNIYLNLGFLAGLLMLLKFSLFVFLLYLGLLTLISPFVHLFSLFLGFPRIVLPDVHLYYEAFQ